MKARKVIPLSKKQDPSIDSVGIDALRKQLKYDDGLVVLDEKIADTWNAGDFLQLCEDFYFQGQRATDNLTRILLAADERGIYDVVKERFRQQLGNKNQTIAQWKTQVSIAKVLKRHGLPIKGIEAIRNFTLTNLKRCLSTPAGVEDFRRRLQNHNMSATMKELKALISPSHTPAEDLVSEEATQDVQFEQYIFAIFKALRPDYVWTHLGIHKKIESGIDIIGDYTHLREMHRIGVQVKCYQENRTVSELDWLKFCAGCTIHKINEKYFVTTGRLSSLQRQQASSCGIIVWEEEQINQQVDRLGIGRFERK